jgi:hypothetical protein
LKSQIGLGVLSLPNALGMLGIVPGILCLIAIAGIMTWSGYVIAEIKLKHKRVCECNSFNLVDAELMSLDSVVDVGELMFGRIGREIFAAIYCTCK